MSFPASYNNFKMQCANYLGITGYSQFHSSIQTAAYTPTISGLSTITVNGATGYSDSLGMCWGTIDCTLANTVAQGRFTYTFPTSFYTEVPAVVYSCNGNDTTSNIDVTGWDTETSETTINIKRDATAGAANLKISWMAQPSPILVSAVAQGGGGGGGEQSQAF
jgi:hypothetical protein